jgi:pSer/pThr/pTyr-binding forkhead associated (FHA) protein
MLVHGRLESNEPYTWKWNITSNQTPSALVTTMSAALTDMWTNGTYGVGSQYAPGIRLDDFDIITLDATFRQTAKLNHALTLVGTSGDSPLSDKTTMVMKKVSTGLRRNQRGFTHLPAPVEGTLTGGLYTTTVRNRFTTAMRAVLSAITADGSTLFVHTGARETVGGVAPYTKTVITDVTCSNKPGTQRNRMNKVVGVYA